MGKSFIELQEKELLLIEKKDKIDKRIERLNIQKQKLIGKKYDTKVITINKFINGFAVVEMYNKYKDKTYYNYLNQQGELLSKEQFNYCSIFFPNGYAIVHRDYGQNVINSEGKLISFVDYKKIFYKTDKLFNVDLSNYEQNLLKLDGTLLSPINFRKIKNFSEGFAVVEMLDSSYNYINEETGELLSPTNFEKTYSFDQGYGFVYDFNNEKLFLDKQGNKKIL